VCTGFKLFKIGSCEDFFCEYGDESSGSVKWMKLCPVKVTFKTVRSFC
jgi:hypothetical protein